MTASDDVAELARCSSPWPLSCLLDTLPMIPSSRLCFAASASRRLCSNAAGIWCGSGEEGVEMSDSSRARAPSPEAGKRSRGDGGFDRLLTFSSGLPLPDPLASPRAEERARSPPSSFPRGVLGRVSSLVGFCPAEGPGPKSREPGGRFSASRSGVSNRTSHPEPGVPSGASIAAPRPPRVSSAARLPPCAPRSERIANSFGVKSGVFEARPASARREKRESATFLTINVTRARSRPTRSGNVT